MSDWKSKLVLEQGETLKHAGSKSKGFMMETDVATYDVVDADGQKRGSVTVEDHTAVRGFNRTIRLVQVNDAGKTLVEETWRA